MPSFRQSILLRRYTPIVLLFAGAALQVWAQTPSLDPVSALDGSTPAAVAAGTPTGTYELSALESVNLFSGTLSFALPLYRAGGRGTAGYTLLLPVGTSWEMKNSPQLLAGSEDPTDFFYPVAHVAPYDRYPSPASPLRYTPGAIRFRTVGSESDGTKKCGSGQYLGYTVYQGPLLTRLTWQEPDGTEHELHDTLNGGQPLNSQFRCTYLTGPSRGTVFVSDDATAATFIADSPVYDPATPTQLRSYGNLGVAGWLLLKDGTRYRFGQISPGTDPAYPNGSNADYQIVDRVGNITTMTITGQATGLQIVDSIGRSTVVSYGNVSAGQPTQDTITYPAADGATHPITVNFDFVQDHLRSDFQAQTSQYSSTGGLPPFSVLFPTSSPSSGTSNFNNLVVSSVALPDGSSYRFQYNFYGELARVNLPTGGAYEYDYPAITGSDCTTSACAVSDSAGLSDIQLIYRRVTARRVYSDTNGVVLEGFTCYSPSYTSQTTKVKVSHFAGSDGANGCSSPSGDTLSYEEHTFAGGPTTSTAVIYPPVGWYPDWTQGRETLTTSASTGSGAVLKSVSTTWQPLSTLAFSSDGSSFNSGLNVTSCQVLTTLDSTATNGSYSVYDQYFNLTDLYEYDFGLAPPPASTCPASVPGGYARHNRTAYKADGTYDVFNPASASLSNHMRTLVTEKDIEDTNNAVVSKVLFSYDETSPIGDSTSVGFIAPLHSKLGNLTSKNVWVNTTSAYLTTTFTYDIPGNVTAIKDPRLNQTQISYADSCTSPAGTLAVGSLYAFPTQVTNPLNQSVNITYDCNLGRQKVFQDANGVRTTYSYSGDPYDRLLLVKRGLDKNGNGISGVETHTAFTYPNLTTTTSAQDQQTVGVGAIQSTTLYDGLGRQSESRRSVDASYCANHQPCYITATQSYDGKGRPYQASLPYNPTAGEAAHFVTKSYDGADRLKSVASDDGAVTNTTYAGSQTTVKDPDSTTRVSTVDGLGHLKSVTEDPLGNNYFTSYKYDVLDDLTSVTQGVLSRSFTYNSLRQLVTAYNPESGLTCYGVYNTSNQCIENYDGDGNLVSKVDARRTTTSYTYDALNRMLTKSYTDSTPPVTFHYDEANAICPYNVGRPTSTVTNGTSLGSQSIPSITEAIYYDALGRPCLSQQTFGTGPAFSFGYTYNLAGGLFTEAYPSGRVVTTSSFDAQNRPASISSPSATYVRSAAYASNDGFSQLQFGASTSPVGTENFTFDPIRQQPTTVSATSAQNATYSQSYYYCPGTVTSCSTNNGNMQSSVMAISGTASGNLGFTQSFGYDGLNRLRNAVEAGGANEWSQGYTPDQWGNHIVSGTILNSNWTPQVTGTFTLSNQFLSNRWIRGTGDGYDAAGNQTSIGSYTAPSVASSTFQFDAENRMTTANIAGMGSVYYAYDGEGRRVMKIVGSTTTQYVYDASGKLAAEYSNGSSSASGTQYLMTDALGSTRMVLNGAGGVSARMDYLPFGEEIPAGIGGRGAEFTSGTYPTSSQIVDQKFTGKERDAETGLDYFGARYYGGAMGRFTSPDEVFADQHPSDPQSWNLYTYGRNNPLRYADPSGRYVKGFAQVLEEAATAAGADLGASFGAVAAFFSLFQGSAGSQGENDALKKIQEAARKNDAEKDADDEPEPEAASGGAKKGGGKRTKHGEERKEDARAGDPNRQGDTARIKREGQAYYDTQEGTNIFVSGDKAVVETTKGDYVTTITNTRANTRNRVEGGRWVPIQNPYKSQPPELK